MLKSERRDATTAWDQWLALAAWLVVSFVAAAAGGIASQDAPQFYAALDRPGWAPPASWFAPVWAVLYFAMGVAAWLVWRARGLRGAPLAFVLFFAQLSLNALWTWIFFVWRLGALASAEIVLLWGLILATIVVFWRIRPLAGALLVPYLAWVTYAAALTVTLWQRNPALLGQVG